MRWMRWVSTIGMGLAVLGLVLWGDPEPPYFHAGILIGILGLVCVAVVGWIDFGRKGQW